MSSEGAWKKRILRRNILTRAQRPLSTSRLDNQVFPRPPDRPRLSVYRNLASRASVWLSGPTSVPPAGFAGVLAHGIALRGPGFAPDEEVYVSFILFATRYMQPEGRLAAAWRTAAAFLNGPHPVPDREAIARLPGLLLPEHPRIKERKKKREKEKKDKGKTLAS